MTVKPLSYNGITFASLGLVTGQPQNSWPGPEIRPRTMNRGQFDPVYLGRDRGPVVRTYSFRVAQGQNRDTVLQNLLGQFNPLDPTERLMTADLNGTTVKAYAAMGQYRGEGFGPKNIEHIDIDFIFSDSRWKELAPTIFGPRVWSEANPMTLHIRNSGKAKVFADVVVRPTTINTTPAQFTVRRTFTITNNGDTTLNNFAYQMDLGNTTGLGSTNEKLTWLFLDGIQQPRDMVAWRETKTYMWFNINGLAPGQTFTYDIAWNGPSDSPTLTGFRRPAFDISWEKRTASAGAAGTVTVAGTPWTTNQWRKGKVYILSGTGAGQDRYISSNTTNVLSLANNWTTNPDATSVLLIYMSDNTRWVYDVRQIERGDNNRGLWYENKGQSKPSIVYFDIPAGWYRTLTLDNNDEKNQSRTFGVDPGGGVDYFNGLDGDRTAQDWASLQEEGSGDGVAFSSQVPLVGWDYVCDFKNPNGMCVASFGARESAGEDWEWFFQSSTASTSLTALPTQTHTFTGDYRHLLACILPVNETEIPVTWKKDTGSHSASTTTTITDSTKAWVTGQWINAVVRITGGKGVGKARTVTGNTGTQLTISGTWGVTLDDTTRFEVVNSVLVSTLRHRDLWVVYPNTTSIVASNAATTASDIFPNYAMRGVIQQGSNSTADVYPYFLMGFGIYGRYLHLRGTEELRFYSETRRAYIYTTATGARVKDVSAYCKALDVMSSTFSKLAKEWFAISPTNDNIITNPNFAVDNTGWVQRLISAGVTASGTTWDGAQGHLTNGSHTINVTASTAGAGATVQWATPSAPPYFPVTSGQIYFVTGWGRRLNANWSPRLGIAWYDSGNTLISVSIDNQAAPGYVYDNTTWRALMHGEIAPDSAVSARVLVVAWENTSSTTGQVWFDEIEWNSMALLVDDQSFGINADMTASIVEAYHG